MLFEEKDTDLVLARATQRITDDEGNERARWDYRVLDCTSEMSTLKHGQVAIQVSYSYPTADGKVGGSGSTLYLPAQGVATLADLLRDAAARLTATEVES